mmetsp:Transcript_23472/g.39303  ORF Transcript_23472/g.39303 Transcript_23472/m.39303 type:complete len:284 (-) Transcript_23472:636-1487(-)
MSCTCGCCHEEALSSDSLPKALLRRHCCPPLMGSGSVTTWLGLLALVCTTSSRARVSDSSPSYTLVSRSPSTSMACAKSTKHKRTLKSPLAHFGLWQSTATSTSFLRSATPSLFLRWPSSSASLRETTLCPVVFPLASSRWSRGSFLAVALPSYITSTEALLKWYMPCSANQAVSSRRRANTPSFPEYTSAAQFTSVASWHDTKRRKACSTSSRVEMSRHFCLCIRMICFAHGLYICIPVTEKPILDRVVLRSFNLYFSLEASVHPLYQVLKPILRSITQGCS